MEAKKARRPKDNGARATKHRKESSELTARHQQRESQRYVDRLPEPTEAEIKEAIDLPFGLLGAVRGSGSAHSSLSQGTDPTGIVVMHSAHATADYAVLRDCGRARDNTCTVLTLSEQSVMDCFTGF